jgi:hypothetical protein
VLLLGGGVLEQSRGKAHTRRSSWRAGRTLAGPVPQRSPPRGADVTSDSRAARILEGRRDNAALRPGHAPYCSLMKESIRANE